MFNANLWVKFDLSKEDDKRVQECITTLIEIDDAIAKCEGQRRVEISQVISLLGDIRRGDVI